MLRNSFRPWGLLPWLLDHIARTEWSFLGCLAPENRCLAAWQMLKSRGDLREAKLLMIEDAPSALWQNESKIKLNERVQEFLAAGGAPGDIKQHHLFERNSDIIEAAKVFANTSSESVCIDISALPKRFFFPIIKLFLQTTRIRNLLAIYTVPERYGEEPLSEDPEPWRHLPTFMPPEPEPKEKVVFVGLGYDPLGLPQLLQGGDLRAGSIKILFPFPARFRGVQKNWGFLRALEPDSRQPRHEPIHVNPLNVSEVFDRILAETNNGRIYAIFAPYGPKPVSLGMCLYARAFQSAVYYTQPRSYNPNYSTGVLTIDGKASIYGYCLRLNGTTLY